MRNWWQTAVSTILVLFAVIAVGWQIHHYTDLGHEFSSLGVSFSRGQQLANVSDISQRECFPGNGFCRHLDLEVPENARLFMPDMTGPTNLIKLGHYYRATYYLFPREVALSLDQPTHLTRDGYTGKTSELDEEILAHGFDLRLDNNDESGTLTIKALHPLARRNADNPPWFDSTSDIGLAFCLPLLTALAGVWLLRFLFPDLPAQMPLPEQLACSLGLGMMAIAAVTLGIKLCGFSGRGLIFVMTSVAAVAEIFCHRKRYAGGFSQGLRKMFGGFVKPALLVAAILVFLVLFRLAGLQGLVDGDAPSWMLKAKILHLYTGSDIVSWFSNDNLAFAHLDYPTLVPSLHSATFDSIGHVDEFVTKFWPVWMLLFLISALASLNHGNPGQFPAPWFALLGLLLLPATQSYVNMEGSTVPMLFFAVMGFIQCCLWQIGKDSARLGLGLTLLFGSAMTTFQGFIILALALGSILLMPSTRQSLKVAGFWRATCFCLLVFLPFLGLRIRLPALHYESHWMGYAAHDPGTLLGSWPSLVMIQLARIFFNPDFAAWDAENGHLHWTGHWDGLASLYNHSTLGLAWLCLILTVMVWFTIPARRQVAIWMFAMFAGLVMVLAAVFASFVSQIGLDQAIRYTNEEGGGRYLFPLLVAWFAALLSLLYLKIDAAPRGATPCE